jgi:bacterioferritin-associated ferredoxin
MLICHCRAITDAAIRATVLAGALDPDEVVQRCGAGGRCGGCLPAVRQLLEQLAVGTRHDVGTSAA